MAVAAVDLVLASLTPAGTPYLNIYLVQSLDGTTYGSGPSATNRGTQCLVARIDISTGASAKREMSAWFNLPPGKFKLVLENKAGVALGAANNTVTLYTSNDKMS